MSAPKNLFNVNVPLAELVDGDPGLSDNAKKLFKLLCSLQPDHSFSGPNEFCELFRRNYVWIEGFPPPPVRDRSKWANRKRALKALWTGDL